jgi:hypothetical protein
LYQEELTLLSNRANSLILSRNEFSRTTTGGAAGLAIESHECGKILQADEGTQERFETSRQVVTSRDVLSHDCRALVKPDWY